MLFRPPRSNEEKQAHFYTCSEEFGQYTECTRYVKGIDQNLRSAYTSTRYSYINMKSRGCDEALEEHGCK